MFEINHDVRNIIFRSWIDGVAIKDIQQEQQKATTLVNDVLFGIVVDPSSILGRSKFGNKRLAFFV